MLESIHEHYSIPAHILLFSGDVGIQAVSQTKLTDNLGHHSLSTRIVPHLGLMYLGFYIRTLRYIGHLRSYRGSAILTLYPLF